MDYLLPGAEGDGPSITAAVSANGRFVAFASEAANLVPDDHNGFQDIFVHDLQTGATTRVSIGIDAEADDFSEVPDISADGRFIAFHSLASNLVPYDNNMDSDIFIYDRQTSVTTRVSITSNGSQAAGGSYNPAISADGRFVAFASIAGNLDGADDNPWTDVFVHDRQTGQTRVVSVDSAGKQSEGFADHPAITADGRYVAFSSLAPGLVANDENGVEDVFVHDRQTGETERVSVRSDGSEVAGESYEPDISAGGRFVAFWSYANDLTDDLGVSWWNVYVHDRQTGATTLISRGADGGAADNGSTRPRLSGDGRYVVFDSEASNLTDAVDDNGTADVFIHDRMTGETVILSTGPAGPGDGESVRPTISADGRYAVFHSQATNLVADDQNGTTDVFIRDATAGTTARVSLAGDALETQAEVVYLGYVSRD